MADSRLRDYLVGSAASNPNFHSYVENTFLVKMYIKQVIIQGFKSYKDKTVVEPFDKRHNVVVGRNGSGKSNFFLAIEFALSDEYSHLRDQQRQGLLYEGTGARAVSAYVEIIFDNSDSRIPIKQEEVSLKRVIGIKKDQYYLNKRLVTRPEIVNLFESAGFSNYNPYYIVKQGKISEVATAPDSYRLKLLCEVAGTRVYDERRDESIATLRETKIKFNKVEKFLNNINDRLRALEEETEELKQYQQFDKMRRTLEYVIHEAQLNENKNKLLKLTEQRDKSGSMQKKLKENLAKVQTDIKKVAKTVKDARNILNQLKEELDILTNDQQNLISEKAKLELAIKDLQKEISSDEKSKERADEELAMLVQTIAEKEAQLEKIRSEYVTKKKHEAKCSSELAMKEQKRIELYAKQARGTQFASKDDRDKWIQKQLEALDKQLKDKQHYRDQLEADLEIDAKKVIELRRKIEEHIRELDKQKKSIIGYKESIHRLKKNKNQLQTTRSELWHKENNVQQNMNSLKEDLINSDREIMKSRVSRAILNGIDSVRKVLETFASRGGREAGAISHYHGLLADNFECQKNIYTAVEVTAGNRLFYHIVDTDVVATTILKEMNGQSLPGEVNFLSLNRLDVGERQYPQNSEAVPIITQLRYDKKCDKAMRFVFGKTMICRSLEVATKLAKSAGLDCVTMDGDKAESKGVLTGGYYHPSLSRLEIYKNRRDIFAQHQQCRQELEHIKADILETNTSIDGIDAEMQKIQIKVDKAEATYGEVNAKLRFLRDELSNIERIREPKELLLTECKFELEAIQNTKELLESELHQEKLSQLSVEEQQQLEVLNSDIQRLQVETNEVVTARIKLEAEKDELENLLNNNLIKRKHEILNVLQEIDLEDKNHQLANAKANLKEIDSKIDKINQDLTTMEKKMKDISNRLKNGENELENLKKEERKTKDDIDEDARNLEKLATKQTQLEQKIAESMEKINQLGFIAAQELYNQYSNMPAKYLFRELEKVNNNMKKFAHVNKKAFDQFMTLNEDKKKIQKRKEDCGASYQKLEELLATLDQQKREVIYFTFKQCSKYFTEVFKKLVPKGTAKLILKKADRSEDDEMGSEKTFDNLTGIGIKVSFTGTDAELKQLGQLSGGQKSIVALALIFAIQKCDPAPFYLFDEIDQALDPQHREAVANMIHELSQQAQFITTTFRPELLEHANKFYGVKFRNKVSYIECVSKEEAKDFVEDGSTYS